MHTATGQPDHRTRKPADLAGRGGFTLVELTVVVALLILLMAIAAPTVLNVINQSANAQAYNTVASQISAARAEAIDRGTFALLHIQMVDPDKLPDEEGTCWSAVLVYDEDDGVFKLPEGYQPTKLPVGAAFGELTEDFVNADGTYNSGNLNGDAAMDDFTSFSVVFDAQGRLTRKVAGQNVRFTNASGSLFNNGSGMWDLAAADDEPGVTAMTIFEFRPFQAGSGDQRADLLNESGTFLPINVYTGEIFPRRGE